MTNQIEYDEEVAHFARQRLFDFARRGDGRPFCLTVSFTHPHDPYVMRRKYWDLYDEAAIPMPGPPMPYEGQDPHSRRILDCDFRRFDLTVQNVRDARHAYFAAVSYLDDRIGELLETLAACRFADDTIVVFTSDHGDMLGERGLWFKMNFFEPSARVPLLIHAPGRWSGRAIEEPTSLLDILPTLVELAGGSTADLVAPIDGQSLVPLALGKADPGRGVVAEYAAETALAPMLMVRAGTLKFIYSEPIPRFSSISPAIRRNA